MGEALSELITDRASARSYGYQIQQNTTRKDKHYFGTMLQEILKQVQDDMAVHSHCTMAAVHYHASRRILNQVQDDVTIHSHHTLHPRYLLASTGIPVLAIPRSTLGMTSTTESRRTDRAMQLRSEILKQVQDDVTIRSHYTLHSHYTLQPCYTLHPRFLLASTGIPLSASPRDTIGRTNEYNTQNDNKITSPYTMKAVPSRGHRGWRIKSAMTKGHTYQCPITANVL